MRVGCVNTSDVKENIRVGGIYTVKEVTPTDYVIENDAGVRVGYPQKWFIKFASDQQADLFEQYIKAQEEIKRAEEHKNYIFQKLVATGLQQGDIIYKTALLNGLL
jgi:hypothetical protein